MYICIQFLIMPIFSFKKFNVKQNQSAAKVGTDGVLLGAWAPIDNNPQSILDIGTGTGLIALMLAQRTENADITAIEIDRSAYEECSENFSSSPWSQRLQAILGDIGNVALNQSFDLIVSNPPFYTEKTFAPDYQRNLARNAASLDFNLLIEKSASLLNFNGIFTVIIPFKDEDLICCIAERNKLFPFKLTRIKGHSNAIIKRSLIAFTTKKEDFNSTDLIIEEKRHQYTAEYQNLTKDFYLKM